MRCVPNAFRIWNARVHQARHRPACGPAIKVPHKHGLGDPHDILSCRGGRRVGSDRVCVWWRRWWRWHPDRCAGHACAGYACASHPAPVTPAPVTPAPVTISIVGPTGDERAREQARSSISPVTRRPSVRRSILQGRLSARLPAASPLLASRVAMFRPPSAAPLPRMARSIRCSISPSPAWVCRRPMYAVTAPW